MDLTRAGGYRYRFYLSISQKTKLRLNCAKTRLKNRPQPWSKTAKQKLVGENWCAKIRCAKIITLKVGGK